MAKSLYISTFLSLLFFAALVSACGDDPTPDPTVVARMAEDAVRATLTAQPTSTSLPTSTPAPPAYTPTPLPTATREPITPTNTPIPLLAVVDVNRLNVRGSPTASSEKLSTISQGTSLTVIGEKNGCEWLQVIDENGQEGWIAGEYSEWNFECADIQSGARSASLDLIQEEQTDESSRQQATVTDIVDGDTIRVLIDGEEQKLRYIGIDSPDQGDFGYHAATDLNRQLVDGTIVFLEKDVNDTDRTGRLLRYVYLADGTFVNLALIEKGAAEAKAYPPDTKYQSEFEAANKQAVADQVGLWKPSASANKTGNLRAGPSTSHPRKGRVTAGQPLSIVGRNLNGDWFALANGRWIYTSLVDNPPADLPVAKSIPTPPPLPTATPAPKRQQPAPQPRAVCSCSGNVYNCGNFGSWSSAQNCYRYCLQTVGYDVHRLDGDNDGEACESLH